MREMKNNLGNLELSELESLNNILEQSNGKEALQQQASSIKKGTNLTIVIIISLVLLLLVNFSLDVYQSYASIAQMNHALAISYLVLYFLAIAGIAIYIVSSIKSYIDLKDAFNIQNKTLDVKNYEEEKEVALEILHHYKKHYTEEIRLKANQLYAQTSGNTLHSPFISIKEEIIDELDKEAINKVYSSAKEVSLFTAFSPGSALDSLAVIFSSLKLMKNIFRIYGYRTNLFSSLLIVRKILENASIAALVEYADDSVNDMLGNTLVAKLSTKMAQGIGNGVLMLRIGNILIQSARPFASEGSIGSYKHMVKLFIEYIKEKFRRE